MNAKLYFVESVAFLWCIFVCKAESPLVYLYPPYPNQHGYAQTGSSFGSPPYTASGFVTSRIFIPRRSYVRSKVYPIPAAKYNLRTAEGEDDYENEPSQYGFYYNVYDDRHGTEFGHKEYGDGHVAKGQYVVLLPDGRRQIVDYVADGRGYRPTIRYEGGYERLGFR